MSGVVYCAIVCDVDGCERESTFEPTPAKARRTAQVLDGWHFRRLGGERWYCPEHEAEWQADTRKKASR